MENIKVIQSDKYGKIVETISDEYGYEKTIHVVTYDYEIIVRLRDKEISGSSYQYALIEVKGDQLPKKGITWVIDQKEKCINRLIPWRPTVPDPHRRLTSKLSDVFSYMKNQYKSCLSTEGISFLKESFEEISRKVKMHGIRQRKADVNIEQLATNKKVAS